MVTALEPTHGCLTFPGRRTACLPGMSDSESGASVSYQGRKLHEPLAEFVGTNAVKQTREQRARLINYLSAEYTAGRSLRELAELTGRSQGAVRRALDEAGVHRRGPDAYAIGLPGGN